MLQRQRVFYMMLTIGGGSGADHAFEQTAEIVKIQYAAMLGNGLHLQMGGFKQMLSHGDAAAVDIGREGLSGLLFK